MELQTERQLEQFLRLAELPASRPDERMEFSWPPCHFYIECVDKAILLSLGREVEPAYQLPVLEKLLAQALPARSKGTPLRVWSLRGRQMLSCTLSTADDVPHWLYCLQMMQRMLDNAIGVKK